MAEQPEGLFINLTLAQVQAIQAAAVEMLAQGKTTMSGSVAGQSFTKQLAMPIDKTLRECNYAISILTGANRPVRRVVADFSGRRGRYCGY